MRLFISILAAFLLLCAAPAHAASLEYRAISKEQAQEPLPEVALVEVRKRERRMYLMDTQNNVVKSYQIALGKNPDGPKQQEGDGRTPEGRYVIDARNERSGYYRSLRISYPGPADVKRAKKLGVKPGGDIFIHGKPNFKFWMFWKYNKDKDWTNGCIAVDDKDMRELWRLVKEGTPIILKP